MSPYSVSILYSRIKKISSSVRQKQPLLHLWICMGNHRRSYYSLKAETFPKDLPNSNQLGSFQQLWRIFLKLRGRNSDAERGGPDSQLSKEGYSHMLPLPECSIPPHPLVAAAVEWTSQRKNIDAVKQKEDV